MFLAGEGWWMGFESIDQPSQSSEVEHNPKMNILFFDDLGGLFHLFAFWSTFFARIVRLIIRS